MTETQYLKCACEKCGESIEFPAQGIGLVANCPHCGEKTTLLADSKSAAQTDASEIRTNGNSKPTRARILFVAFLTAIGLIGIFLALNFSHSTQASRAGLPDTNGTVPKAVEGSAPSSAPLASSAEEKGKRPKSLGDLKVGLIALEKAKGSRLVYAVGTMKNDSDHQRFGVNIELELTDRNGNKAGTAKDYRSLLEPHQEWRFRALVLDSKAVAAKVFAIREEK